MGKHIRWVRAVVGGKERIMELGTIKANSLNIELPPTCPCCEGPVSALIDITQYGFFEDRFIVLFACAACMKAWWYNYTLSAIEMMGGSDGDNSAQS